MKPPNHMEQATQRLSINKFVIQSLQIRNMYYNGYTMYTLCYKECARKNVRFTLLPAIMLKESLQESAAVCELPAH